MQEERLFFLSYASFLTKQQSSDTKQI